MLKKTVRILILTFLVSNVSLGLLGLSSVFLTCSIYFLTWLLFKQVISLLGLSKNVLLFSTVALSALFTSELILKYAAKTHLSYSEKAGKMFYNSMYKTYFLERTIRKYIDKVDVQLLTRPPNTEEKLVYPEFTYVHKYNSLGLRDKEPFLDTGSICIIGLGDSFTEGVGSSQDSTWVRLLEQGLQKKYPQEGINIINGGLNGSDPIASLKLLNKKLIGFNPKIVIVCINSSDVTELIIRGGKERFANESVEYSKGPWWEFIYSFSYISRVLLHSIFEMDYTLLTKNQYQKRQKKALVQLKECVLKDYKGLSKTNGFKLVVVFHPMLHELEQGFFPLEGLFNDLVTDSSFTTVNMFEEYLANQPTERYEMQDIYWALDGHHNSHGYELWAQILMPKIDSLLLKNENSTY